MGQCLGRLGGARGTPARTCFGKLKTKHTRLFVIHLFETMCYSYGNDSTCREGLHLHHAAPVSLGEAGPGVVRAVHVSVSGNVTSVCAHQHAQPVVIFAQV